jgi:arsenate reductase-like glutaredoxin family protein
MFEKQGASSTANLDATLNSKLELKKIDESSNNDLTFFMEQEEDLYATLDDRDSISSENMNSFNKTTYLRTDEVSDGHLKMNLF